ncbi:hypothetical protein [Vibrio splendidus]|uniref:hypothetical protein n=1 Tax=Vibrio splendidus TaxID=29497 RepID=UPI000D3A06CE|nr:hypothetical protein [Vibrio splendidus]PTP68886.1 hypothetical protein CWO31_00440 [Vibrio splendidus]PTQ05510.1 hypothetical protein CWO28_12085 [Vibrio splendidus]UOE90297.1 hypothetical protein LTQ02_07370 [Vibrio splendidus]
MIRIFLIALLSLHSFLSYASSQESTKDINLLTQKKSEVSEPFISSTLSNDENTLLVLNDQLKELKIENKLLKEHQSSILSTVYWSLSFLAGIALILLTFGWWSNSKMHDKDKLALVQQFETLLAEHKGQIYKDTSEKWDKFSNSLNKEVSDVLAVESKNMESLSSSLVSQITKLSDATGGSVEALKFLIDNQRLDTRKLTARVFDIEERVWELKGVHKNVILTQAQLIEVAHDIEDEVTVKYTLLRIIDTLRKFNLDDIVLEEYYVELLSKHLKKLNSEHNVLVSEILDLLDEVKKMWTFN